MQGLAETSQVYEAQKLRELEIFPSAWMSFGLNTRKSDSSEHTGWMEKLQSCGQQRLLNKAKRRKSTWSDSLPIFLAKEHKTRTRRNWATLWTPLEGINSWWGWRRSCACAHSTWSRREQGAQPAEHRVHGQHGRSPTSNMQASRFGFILFFPKVMQP